MSASKRAVVILGAGASHDLMSPQDEQLNARAEYRPPLAEDVFSVQRSFQEILEHYPDASALAETIRVKHRDKALEAVLKDFSESRVPHRVAQFREVPLYLQHLFGVVSERYTDRQPHNYAHLVNHMLAEFERVAFITLNYDLFLERALGVPSLGGPIDSLEAYVSPNRLLVKLHGSVNWGRRIKDWLDRVVENNVFELDLSRLGEARVDDMVEPAIQLLPFAGLAFRWVDGEPYYPALVVPIEGKYGFVCPPEHLDQVKHFLPECQNILVIGCSGRDEDLLHLLRDSMTGCDTFFLVGKGSAEVEGARERFLRGVPQLSNAWRRAATFADGFSDFVANQGVERFAQSCPE